LLEEKFKDTTGVIRSQRSKKDREHNEQTKKEQTDFLNL
jgi:hypothetical protein